MNTEQNQPSVFAVASDAEWNFGDCPDEQLHWCDVYEHARDNELVVATVDHYRASGRWVSSGIFPDHWNNLLGKMLVDAFREFPAVPFMSVDAETRAARCRKLDQVRRQIHVQVCKDGSVYHEGDLHLRIHPSASMSDVDRVVRPYLREKRGGQTPTHRLQYLTLARLFEQKGNWGSVIDQLEKGGSALADYDESQRSTARRKATTNIADVVSRVV